MDLKDNWTELQTRKLIRCYKHYPNLWDCNNKMYKNRNLRKNCLRLLAQKLTDIKSDTTINDVRAKLKTLRSQFSREKRRLKQILSQGGTESFEPKLWCYEDLKFIDVNENNQKDCSEVNDMDYQISDEALAELLEVESPYEARIERRGRPSRFSSWSKEQTFSLIRLFKEYPLLYDSTHPKYALPIHRNRALREIHEKMISYKSNVTLAEMRAKLKTLRSQYVKEKRKAAIKKYTPKLWFYEKMKFLDDRGKFLEEERDLRISEQNQEFQVGEQPDDCYVGENENEIFVKSFDDSDLDEVPEASPPSSVSESKPRSVLYQKCLSLVETLSTQTEDKTIFGSIKEKTPAALLGRMVETELSNFPEDIYEDAKWKIIKVLEDASKKNKENNSYTLMTLIDGKTSVCTE